MNYRGKSVVVDMGAYELRAGVAGESNPTIECRSIVARERKNVLCAKVGIPKLNELNLFDLSTPLQPSHDGAGEGAALDVTSWPDIEILLEHALHAKSNETHAVLLSEPVFASLASREYLTQLLFEKFDAPAALFVPQALLSMYSCGVMSGMSVDFGLNSTRVVPIFDGKCSREATHAVPVGGLAVSAYLQALLRSRHNTELDLLTVNALKEAHAFVASSVASKPRGERAAAVGGAVSGAAPVVSSAAAADAMQRAHAPLAGTQFVLPDDNRLDVGAHAAELSRCTDAYFDPTLVGQNAAGLSDTIACSMLASLPERRSILASNVCVGGGASEVPGMGARMLAELAGKAVQGAFSSDGADAKATQYMLHVSPSERKHSVWLGGSIVARLSTFASCWLTKATYDESGAFAMHQKCCFD